jgi:hypothetical protein
MEQSFGAAALTFDNLEEYTAMFEAPDGELALFDPPLE